MADKHAVREIVGPNGILSIHGDGYIAGQTHELTASYRKCIMVISFDDVECVDMATQRLRDLMADVDKTLEGTEL